MPHRRKEIERIKVTAQILQVAQEQKTLDRGEDWFQMVKAEKVYKKLLLVVTFLIPKLVELSTDVIMIQMLALSN